MGLVDQIGEKTEPHNWNGRQFQNDVSTERVKRFRERQKKPHETVSRNAPDTEQTTDTEQNRTEKKKERAEVALPIWLPLDAWLSFVKTRKRMTPRASELLISALTKFREEGDDPKSVLEQSVMNGWTGLFPLKKVNGNGRGNGTQQQGRGLGLAAADAIGKIRRASEIYPGGGASSTGGKCEVLAYDPGPRAPAKANSHPGNGRGDHRGIDDSGPDLPVPSVHDRGEKPALPGVLQRSRPLSDRTD